MSTITYTPAQQQAMQILQQISSTQANLLNTVSRLNNILANGVPAVGANPAISAADIQTALGANLPTVTNRLSVFQTAATS
jgi:hypothetical protein